MFGTAALALALSAQPLAEPKPVHPALLTVSVVGAALMGAGLGVELSARLQGDASQPVSAWSEDLRARVAGGVGLTGAGLCLLTLAALVGQHRLPSLAFWPTPGGLTFTVSLRWP